MINTNRFCVKLFLLTAFVFWQSLLLAQQTYLPINSFTNYHISRLDIAGITDGFNTSLRPISRENLNRLSPTLAQSGLVKNSLRYFKTELYEYPSNDTAEFNKNLDFNSAGKRKVFYKTPMALYSQKMKDFTLMINPVIGFAGGRDLSDNNNTHQLTGGIELRGMIDRKVGFYSLITKNYIQFPTYINQMVDSSGVIAGEGYHVNEGDERFFKARGYFTFSPTRHIGLQFGQDQNFIGNGYRSLVLSNHSKDYLFLKVNTKIWKLNYQNLFTQITDYTRQSATGKGIKPKFFVNHYLGIKLFKNLEIGVFESIIFDRSDSVKKGYFDLNYLNPIIFYEAVENDLNSSDNVILGGDWKWNFLQRFSFYGQLVLDEFNRKELSKRSKWWANKYAIQAGLKYINAFTIKGLDLQVEYNLARPYTYSHFKRSQNYVNYNQPLAHPLGANFKELLGIIKYQPSYKLFVETGLFFIIKGLDSSSKTKHFGGNILETYGKRPYEYGHNIAQGVNTNYSMAFLHVSYMAYHNIWLDARANIRLVKSDLTSFNSESSWFQLGLRMNLSMRDYDF